MSNSSNLSGVDRIRPIPLPCLTSLLAKHARSHVDVKWHILLPLAWVAVSAIVCAQNRSGTRMQILAEAKSNFIEQVYLSSASLELKREMFALPLEELFDMLVQELANVIPPYGDEDDEQQLQKTEEIQQYLILCASHPGLEADDSLGPLLLRHFNRDWLAPDLICGFVLPSDYQEQQSIIRSSPDECWPGMSQIFKKMGANPDRDGIEQPPTSSEDVHSVLRQFIQLAMNCVDLKIMYLNTDAADPVRRHHVLDEGEGVVTWAWRNMLDDPFSNVTTRAKQMLVDLNLRGSIKLLLYDFLRKPLRLEEPEYLHLAVYMMILCAAANNQCWTSADMSKIKKTIGPSFPVPPSILHSGGESPRPPTFYRPQGTWDQITDELNARLRQYDSGELTDVPLELVGTPIDPRSLSQTAVSAPTDEKCTVCLDSFDDVFQEFVKLNACQHVIHFECLDALVNQIYPGRAAVRCPYCRAELCKARDYRAVLE